MEQDPQAQWQPRNPPRRSKSVVYTVLFYVLAIYYVIETLISWQELTSCFKREAVFICVYLFYLRFADSQRPSLYLDLVQILSILWIIAGFNNSDDEADPNCMDAGEYFFLKTTQWLFNFLLWFYTVMTFCIVILLLFVIIYGILEMFYLQPRRRRRQGLSPEEYSKLEKVEFKKEGLENDSNLDTCSICLEEFVDNELVMQMPVCNHNFHDICAKGWLDFHSICPYCRSDIRQNLGAVRERNAA